VILDKIKTPNTPLYFATKSVLSPLLALAVLLTLGIFSSVLTFLNRYELPPPLDMVLGLFYAIVAFTVGGGTIPLVVIGSVLGISNAIKAIASLKHSPLDKKHGTVQLFAGMGLLLSILMLSTLMLLLWFTFRDWDPARYWSHPQ
jgi:hypothetical protein